MTNRIERKRRKKLADEALKLEKSQIKKNKKRFFQGGVA